MLTEQEETIKNALSQHKGILVDYVEYIQPGIHTYITLKDGGWFFQPDNAEIFVRLGSTYEEALGRAKQGPPF